MPQDASVFEGARAREGGRALSVTHGCGASVWMRQGAFEMEKDVASTRRGVFARTLSIFAGGVAATR
jgi:hypothetical protein